VKTYLNLCFLILLLAGLCSCTDHRSEGEKREVFRYNESAGITSLDPAFAKDQANIWAVNQLFNGLVQFDEQLSPQASIAKRWTISADGLIYTFYLRDDVRFHNSEVFPGGRGRIVVASDFVFSFNRILDPKLASPGAWIFNQVAENGPFTALNDTTFQVRLKEPFPPFLGLLGMQYCSVVPFEAVRQYNAGFRKSPVGTGPFRFKMWKEGVKLVLLRNDHYFEYEGKDRLPYLDAVAVTFIPDKQTAFLEFIKGNLDFISGIDAGYKDELLLKSGELNPKYASTVKMLRSPYLNTEYLGILADSSLPVMHNHPLNDLRIRKALNYGIDRVSMMKHLRNGIGIPGMNGMVPPGLPWFDQNLVTGYSFDPVKARALLEEAGYPGGKGLPPITLSTNASYLDLCRFLQSQWNNLGFTIKIDVTPPATLRSMIAAGRVSFFRGSWIADYPDAENYLSLFYSIYKSPAGPNYTHYSNPAYDLLYRQSSRITNDSLRAMIYRQMDQMLIEDAPVIVLYYDEVLRFSSHSVSGLGCNSMNLLTLKYVKKTHGHPVNRE